MCTELPTNKLTSEQKGSKIAKAEKANTPNPHSRISQAPMFSCKL